MNPQAPFATDLQADLARAAATCRWSNVQCYLESIRQRLAASSQSAGGLPALQRQAAGALQLAGDAANLPPDSPWSATPLLCYAVPPLSPIKRLPGDVPADGQLGGAIHLIAARGEFEPVSFVAVALEAIEELEVTISELTGAGQPIPASAVDMKVVKCWYQAGTAWQSYFADPTRRELVPELLLHDDTLLKVDPHTQDNYLRVDYPEGSEYLWVSYTQANDPGFFNHATEPVADAPTLQPTALAAGESRQFWLTVKVPTDAAAGLYRGVITLSRAGTTLAQVPLTLRVLPFTLPEPRTYYDPEKPFYVCLYNHCDLFEHMRLNGNDLEQASRKLLAEYQNLRDHGCDHPLLPRWDRRDLYQGRNRDIFIRQLDVLKQSGLKTEPIFGAINTLDYAMIFKKPAETGKGVFVSQLDATITGTEPFATMQEATDRYQQRIDEEFAAVEEVLGHHEVYPIGWDEPSYPTLVGQRDAWRYIHAKGGHIMSTTAAWHLGYSGYNVDFSNYGGWVSPEIVRRWHAIGAKVACYASPHTGPENPDFIRRTHGMALYKADLDGTCNYMHYEGDPNIWNEFNKDRFRSFCLVYPTRDGVIDTLAWEGFREAVDDIRYATQLRQLAGEAITSGDIDRRQTGKLALQWLSNFDEQTMDLNTMRLEMIQHILKLCQPGEGEDGPSRR